MARMTESTFLSCDGKTELYYREYLPEGNAVGIVQIVHGIAEHVARYDDFAGFLADNGYIVVAHDQLGHGKSVAGEDSIGFFSEEGGWGKAVEDIHKLHDLTAERYPGKPYFIFGHSMGSFLTRTYLIRYRTGLDGAVISGTGQQSGALIAGGKMMSALEIKRHGPRYKSELLNKMAFGSYNDKLGDIRTGFDWLSRNEAVVDAYIDDPLCGFVPSAALLHRVHLQAQEHRADEEGSARHVHVRRLRSRGRAGPGRDPGVQGLPEGGHDRRDHEALPRRTARDAQRAQ